MRVLVKKARGFTNPDKNIKGADSRKVFRLKPSLEPQTIPESVAAWIPTDPMWEWCIKEGSILILQDAPVQVQGAETGSGEQASETSQGTGRKGGRKNQAETGSGEQASTGVEGA